MIVCSCSFSELGALCEEKLFPRCPEITWISQRHGYVINGCMSMTIQIMPDIKDFIAEAFRKRLPVLFIGATGIAVRLLAENGRHVGRNILQEKGRLLLHPDLAA